MNMMTAKSKNVKKKAIDKQDAFIEFKNEEHARMLEDSIRDNRNELKNMKSKVKDLTETCNVSKKNID